MIQIREGGCPPATAGNKPVKVKGESLGSPAILTFPQRNQDSFTSFQEDSYLPLTASSLPFASLMKRGEQRELTNMNHIIPSRIYNQLLWRRIEKNIRTFVLVGVLCWVAWMYFNLIQLPTFVTPDIITLTITR